MARTGRPTDYKPEYCEMVIEWLATGKSLQSFAGSIDAHIARMYDWANAHPEFAEAVKIGRAKQAAFYEDAGIAMINGTSKGNLGALVWLTKNMLKWRDQALADPLDAVNEAEPTALTDAALTERLKQLADRAIHALDARTIRMTAIDTPISVPVTNDKGTHSE